MEQRKIDLEEVSLEMILHGGNARAESYNALKLAREGRFDEANKHLEMAEADIKQAHEAQTALLQSEGEGARMKADLLFVHAHGHLQTAMSEKGLIEEMIHLYRKLHKDYLHHGK